MNATTSSSLHNTPTTLVPFSSPKRTSRILAYHRQMIQNGRNFTLCNEVRHSKGMDQKGPHHIGSYYKKLKPLGTSNRTSITNRTIIVLLHNPIVDILTAFSYSTGSSFNLLRETEALALTLLRKLRGEKAVRLRPGTNIVPQARLLQGQLREVAS